MYKCIAQLKNKKFYPLNFIQSEKFDDFKSKHLFYSCV